MTEGLFKTRENKMRSVNCNCGHGFVLGFVGWLGGAVYTAYQPGMSFWDGVVWLYYVGRFIAAHYTMFSY